VSAVTKAFHHEIFNKAKHESNDNCTAVIIIKLEIGMPGGNNKTAQNIVMLTVLHHAAALHFVEVGTPHE